MSRSPKIVRTKVLKDDSAFPFLCMRAVFVINNDRHSLKGVEVWFSNGKKRCTDVVTLGFVASLECENQELAEKIKYLEDLICDLCLQVKHDDEVWERVRGIEDYMPVWESHVIADYDSTLGKLNRADSYIRRARELGVEVKDEC